MKGIRFYLMGLIVLLIAVNIAEVNSILKDKLKMAEPLVLEIKDTVWSNTNQKIVSSLLARVAPATLYVNNKPVNIDTNSDDFSLSHGPSIDAEQADTILRDLGSPAVGQGAWMLEESTRTHIDLAYVLAMFIHESGAGTNPNWAGYKSATESTHNPGNIICIGAAGEKCYGRFVDYPSWKEGFTAQFDLLAYYRDKDGIKDINAAIAKWAPTEDSNDPTSYAAAVRKDVTAWRQLNSRSTAVIIGDGKVHPLTATGVINVGFYEVNCNYWGFQAGCQHFGTDYRLADGEEVYLPVTSAFIMHDSYPEGGPTAGEYVMFKTPDGYELYFGHLKNALNAKAGDIIPAGTVIGYGRGDLAHTHAQVRDPNGNLFDFEQFYKEHNK
jgi:murein DD-endopeptidase MepM/ murein hydrolase activator NlpD